MPKNPLRDTDYLFATMRVRSMERNLLNRERIDRMLEARTHEDAAKVLYECGYGEMGSVTASEWERVIAEERAAVYRLIGNLSGRREMADVFRMKYDYHNVKTLIKAEVTGENPEHLLVDAGRMPAAALTESMRDQKYNELPGDLKLCISDAREVLARTGDPQSADFLLDRHCVMEMQKAAKASGSAFLSAYVVMYVDIYNLRAVVRTTRLSREPDFLRTVLIGGGSVPVWKINGAVLSGSPLEDVYAGTVLQDAAAAGVAASRGEEPLTVFERLTDNVLVKTLSAAKQIAFGEQPLVAYIAARENEFTTVRTILSGRVAGVAPDVLRERLRDCYV